MAEEQSQQGNPFQRGPYVQVACICEKVLVEQDGVKSAIRIIDRYNRTATGVNPPTEMEPFEISYFYLLKLIPGVTRGAKEIMLQLELPSGETRTPKRLTVHFEPDDARPVDIAGPLQIRVEMPGQYWINVHFEGTRISRMPFQVIYLPQFTGPPPTEDPPDSPDIQES